MILQSMIVIKVLLVVAISLQSGMGASVSARRGKVQLRASKFAPAPAGIIVMPASNSYVVTVR